MRGRVVGNARFCTSRANRSEEHTSELQSPCNLVCRLLLEKKQRQGVDSMGRAESYDRVRPHRSFWRRLLARLRPEGQLMRHRQRLFFFFNDWGPPEINTLPLPEALPI